AAIVVEHAGNVQTAIGQRCGWADSGRGWRAAAVGCPAAIAWAAARAAIPAPGTTTCATARARPGGRRDSDAAGVAVAHVIGLQDQSLRAGLFDRTATVTQGVGRNLDTSGIELAAVVHVERRRQRQLARRCEGALVLHAAA